MRSSMKPALYWRMSRVNLYDTLSVIPQRLYDSIMSRILYSCVEMTTISLHNPFKSNNLLKLQPNIYFIERMMFFMDPIPYPKQSGVNGDNAPICYFDQSYIFLHFCMSLSF